MKKVPTVECVHYTKEFFKDIDYVAPLWFKRACAENLFMDRGLDGEIQTNGSLYQFRENDWLVREENGDIYPYSDEKFKKLFTHTQGLVVRKSDIEDDM